MSTASPRLVFAALHTVEESVECQVVSQRLHSNTTYEYNYPETIDCEHVVVDFTHVFIYQSHTIYTQQ